VIFHLASMITNPGKLVTFPLTVAQMAFTFAESILRLVVHA
jgi:hypothetical protein